MTLAVASASVVYLAGGTLAFRAKHPLIGVPFALILGLVAMIAVVAIAPETPIPDCSS